jgi:hypothetical protein
MPEGKVQFRQWEPGVKSSFGLIHPSASPLGSAARALADILKDIFKSRYKSASR